MHGLPVNVFWGAYWSSISDILHYSNQLREQSLKLTKLGKALYIYDAFFQLDMRQRDERCEERWSAITHSINLARKEKFEIGL